MVAVNTRIEGMKWFVLKSKLLESSRNRSLVNPRCLPVEARRAAPKALVEAVARTRQSVGPGDGAWGLVTRPACRCCAVLLLTHHASKGAPVLGGTLLLTASSSATCASVRRQPSAPAASSTCLAFLAPCQQGTQRDARPGEQQAGIAEAGGAWYPHVPHPTCPRSEQQRQTPNLPRKIVAAASANPWPPGCMPECNLKPRRDGS